ncbi:MAG: DUF177 domain-containing protein [bacterium]
MKIVIRNLANGIHNFEFTASKESLDLEGNQNFVNKIKVYATCDKNDNNVVIKTRVVTLAHFQCDNCLNEFTRRIDEEIDLFCTLQPQVENSDEESVVLLNPRTHELDLTQAVRECLLLAVPMKTVCQDDCKGLCPTCGANLNLGLCDCIHETADPRWDTLKKLLQ